MNFLAHIHLSGIDTEYQLGNFLGDFVVGDLTHTRNQFLTPVMRKGVVLHREIDRYTDNHEVVRQSTHRLMPKYHKFSGIIIDVFYDHFLAKNWKDFSDAPLEEFVQTFYQKLSEFQPNLPRTLDKPINSMISRNWLVNYANFEGIAWTLKGLSKRTTYNSGMENAIEDLKTDYELYKKEFQAFYPQLVQYCENQ